VKKISSFNPQDLDGHEEIAPYWEAGLTEEERKELNKKDKPKGERHDLLGSGN